MDYTVISYHAGPGYAQHAEQLKQTLEHFNIRHDIEAVEDKGTWASMTSYKSQFVQRKLQEHDTPLVWLDADARVRRQPELFSLLDPDAIDLAVHYRKGRECLSGTVWFANSDNCKILVDNWVKQCAMQPNIWDQKLLDRAIRLTECRCHQLPPEYTYIECFMNDCTPVIEHLQASRTLKRR